MKNYFFAFLLLMLNSLTGFAQAQLVLNNDPYINIGTGTYLVLANGNANAITQVGTGGRIITEGETNRIRWNITSNTGSYVVPFFDNDHALEIPYTLTVGVAGAAGGYIDFSTYDNTGATPWNNAGYMPSDVTNMNSFVGGANNSAKVIDRFWIIDASSYTTKPTATMAFTYIDAEWMAAGNTITEGNLGAQRFETPSGDWDSYVPQGTASAAANTVTGVPVAPADFWRSWTLSDNTSPLPIELISFEGNCSNGSIILKWSTATETNNDYFTIERSDDGINFHSIGTLDGAGNSSSILNYSFSDAAPLSNGNYYRIRQTDYNGDSKTTTTIYVAPCADPGANMDIYNQGENQFTVVIDAEFAGNYTIRIFNALGQIVTSNTLYVAEGFNKTTIQLENIDDAMYFVNITNGSDRFLTKKIIINQ